MEDESRDVFSVFHELVHLGQELLRRDISRSLDISACPVVIAYVDDQVVFARIR